MSHKKNASAQYSSLAGIHRAVPIILFALAVFTTFCFFTQDIAGALGDVISAVFLGLFSYGAYAIPVLLAVHAIFYPSDIAEKRVLSRLIFSVIAIFFISALAYSITYWNEGFTFNAVQFFKDGQNTVGGGFFGGIVGYAIIQIVGKGGLVTVAAAILAIYVTYFFSKGQKGLATVFYLLAKGILSILSLIERAVKGVRRKAKNAKSEKAKRNADLKNLELTDDEYFDADNGMKRLSISALGIKVTKGDADADGGTTLHDKVFHKSAVSKEEAEEMELREAAERLFYGTDAEEPAEEPVITTARRTVSADFGSFDFVDAAKTEKEPDTAPERPVTPTAEAAGRRDDSADSVFTKTFDPFGMAMSEKLASKPSSRSLLDEKPQARVREDVSEMTPEEIEREKRVLEFERRKAALVNANRPTPVENDGEFKGTPKTVDFHERKDESVSAPPRESAAASFVFNKTDRPYEAPKAEPANYTSISFGDEAEHFSTVVSKPAYTPTATVSPRPAEVETPKHTYTAPHSATSVDSGRPAPSYTEESASHIFGMSADGSYTVYSPAESRGSTPTAASGTDRAAQTPFSMDHSDGEIFSFSSGKSYEEPVARPAYTEPVAKPSYAEPVAKPSYAETVAKPSYAEPVVKPSYAEPVATPERTASSYATSADREPEIKEYVPEFKPYQAPSDEDVSATEVNVITLEEEPAAPVSTLKIERERVMDDDDIYAPEDGEDEVYADDDMPVEDEDSGFDEEIPEAEQNPKVQGFRDMFTALRGESDTNDADDADEDTYASITDEADDVAEQDENVEPEWNADEDEDEPPFEHSRVTPEPKTEKPKKAEPEKAEKKKPDYAGFKFPPIDLLGLDPVVEDDQSEIQENTKTLIDTLASFNVTASIKGVDRGPRITRYEVVPARGVKVNAITNLFNDIKLNLGKEGVRMEAPIPGKSAIGFEIPNANPTTVRLRELIECEEFHSPKASDTFVAIGKDVSGNPVFGDICKYPHALICGATGMGKSVSINSILVSMLYRAHPKDVKLIMIDPKKVEFKMYSGIPHLLIPVITESKQAAGALMWAVEEMERRYELIETHSVRNIEAYNQKVAENPSMGESLPKIIIVIDELADLMMQVRDPVEDLIMRIAQKARAAGIHLIIGTQRPSTNIITGSIKANIPSRISCKVTSQIDSRTIFDTKGAEELLNKGDMLYWPVDRSSPLRVQGAFVSDKEVEDVMKFLKDQMTESVYDEEIFTEINKAAQKCGNKKSGAAASDDVDTDDGETRGYYNDQQFLDAVELAIRSRKVSTSLLQRKLSIGYGKAAKYIDAMQDIGIVSEPNGQKPREVLLTMDEWHEKLSRVEF